MSYDFTLFKPRDGEDPHITAQRDSNEFPSTPPDPQKEALKGLFGQFPVVPFRSLATTMAFLRK